ncbi:MAG: hypothetical protein IAE99_07885 [Rhodothermales bacterium]|nr:hypothetical protein [Rhodothermales bacterium]
MTSMTTKRAALAAAVLRILSEHDARYRVAEHLDEVLLDLSSSEREQIRVMGSPARYAEVLYSGEAEALPGYTNVRGRATESRETFEVNVWWEISRTNRPADQTAWEACWKGGLGLVTILQRSATLSTAERAVLIDAPVEVQTYATQIRTGVLAHFGRLVVTLT